MRPRPCRSGAALHSAAPLPWPLPAAFLLAGACAPLQVPPEDRGDDAAAVQDVDPLAQVAFPEEGLLPLAWDAAGARLLLRVPTTGQPLLYVVSLPQGLGSNDVGLDRGQLGSTYLVEFRRVGARLLLVAPNQRWRTSATEAAVREGTRRAFAESVLWSFEVVADTAAGAVVDATSFCLRDAHDVARKLEAGGQGPFQLDAERSVVLPDELRVFPANVAVDTLQTFGSDRPGGEVRATTPAPNSVTLRVRHAFVALPDLATGDYVPRRYHPRSGYSPHTWNDANAALGSDTLQRVVRRHHVTREEPLVYFIDRAAPEPVRTALLEGARYWEPIFDAAVFPGAFRAELLPEGADADDARWNIVQWVERSTRGWSYGNSVIDPRTGQILKGHVTLGALRVRQDVTLFEALTGPYADGEQDPVLLEAALARIRQLSAHEIGHTLGLAHNFAASVDGRASVMDYPAPLVTLDPAGAIDLSDAYAPGCGAWDHHAIRYGYGRFEDERAGLAATLAEAAALGLHYASDDDARGADRAHPLANLWDNGTDAVARLADDLEVRAAALARFSSDVVDPARTRFDLERSLVPLYLWHRYQVEAVARLVGGRWYGYALAGESAEPVRPVAADRQTAALAALGRTLQPEVLALAPELVAELPPPPPGYGRDRETFAPTGPLFDPLTAAAAAADVTLGLLLEPARCARLVDQHALDPSLPGLREVLDGLVARWFPGASAARPAATDEVVRTRLVAHLIRLAEDVDAPARVRDPVLASLAAIEAALVPTGERLDLLETLRRRRSEPRSQRAAPTAPPLPPGSPIGVAPLGCSQDGEVAANPLSDPSDAPWRVR